MSTEFWTMVITTARASLGRAIAAALSPAGVGMFVVGLCPADGPAAAEPTNFISTGRIDARFAPLLKDGAALHSAAQAAGVDCTLAECQALVDEADVSQEPPHPSAESPGALARLGLQIRQDPEGLA